MTQPAVLLLCDADDAVAARIHASVLRRLGESRSRLVVAEELGLARRWSHRVGAGDTTTTIELQSSVVIEAASTAAVLNRLRGVPVPQFANAAPADQSYASVEMHALVTSWLAGMQCPMANRASATALSGPMWSPHERLQRAARAGLPARRSVVVTRAGAADLRGLLPHHPPDETASLRSAVPLTTRVLGTEPLLYLEPIQRETPIYVIGDRVLGAPPAWVDDCRGLAKDAGTVILEICAGERADGSWCVVDVDAVPAAMSSDAIEEAASWLVAHARLP